jgi:hypothetical protein
MNGVEWGFAHFVLNSIYSLGVSAPLGRVTVRIASSKLPWILAKLTKCTLQCSKLPRVLAKFKKHTIASSKLPWVLAKLKKCTLQCSKLPQVLAKFKKCTLQAQNYVGFLQSSRNAHRKLEITSGSCKAQEMHIASLKLHQALAKLKKFMFDAHMGPTHDQSSLSAVYGTITSLGP